MPKGFDDISGGLLPASEKDGLHLGHTCRGVKDISDTDVRHETHIASLAFPPAHTPRSEFIRHATRSCRGGVACKLGFTWSELESTLQYSTTVEPIGEKGQLDASNWLCFQE